LKVLPYLLSTDCKGTTTIYQMTINRTTVHRNDS